MMGERSLLFLCCLAYAILGVLSSPCTTPHGKSGQCIVVKSCPDLLQLLQQRPVSSENVDFLRKSQCGSFEGNQPKVCCEDKFSSSVLPDTTQCGLDPSDRIIGGTRANLKEFPWMALLQYRKPDGTVGFHCGASLISNRYVLTAAHCLNSLPSGWKFLQVRLGEHDLDTDEDCSDRRPGFENCTPAPIDVTTEETIVHEGYNSAAAAKPNDIALLRLSREVAYSESVKPVCLPTAPELQLKYADVNMTVAGWGRTETRRQSNVKLKLEVPVRTATECSMIYSRKNIKLGDGQLCAGGIFGKDSCTGDSGGPLMLNLNQKNWYLSGVVSFGPDPCAIKEWPGVYTKVEYYMPWILQHMKP